MVFMTNDALSPFQELIDLGYEMYSTDLSITKYHFFMHLDNFSIPKPSHCKQDAKNALKDFLASKPLVLS